MDINKQIEEEAEKRISTFNYAECTEYNNLIEWGYDGVRISNDANKLRDLAYKNGFIDGVNYIIDSSRWRKFGVDDLPRLEQQIICRDGDKYHPAKPISHDGIYWLAEHFIEWKPID